MTRKILFVEDDLLAGTAIAELLRGEGLEINIQNSLEGLMDVALAFRPDLFLLDVEVGNACSFDIISSLRLLFPLVPILFASSHNDDQTVNQSYDSGTRTLFVNKPYRIKNVMAHINSLLPDPEVIPCDILPFGKYQLHAANHQLKSPNQTLQHLNPKEFELLRLLLFHKNEPVSRKDILLEIWTDEKAEESLNNCISRLRNFLKEDPQIKLETLRKYGYQLSIIHPQVSLHYSH